MERVAWVASWYGLDQPIAVGLTDEFAFWRVVPDYLRGPERLVLYNRGTPWRPDDVLLARGTIGAISHPDLGEIREVDIFGLDSTGMDYTIHLSDGMTLRVNAEEEPGTLYEPTGEASPFGWARSSRVVDEWRFVVQFDTLDPLAPPSHRHPPPR